MISKPVTARSFYHTCRYICQKPGAEVILSQGVRAHDYALMAQDFERQQQLHPAKTKACFHGILSFYPGERPSDEQMKAIARQYLEGLGITGTQYAVCKHTDKAHLHLHIVANMVNNEGKVIKDNWIGLRGKKIAQRLTQEYKLIPAIGKHLELTHLEALSHQEQERYQIYIAIAEALPRCRTMEELEQRLGKQGIAIQYKYKGHSQEKQGLSFKKGNACFKGSQIDRKFSLAGLQRTLQQQQVREQHHFRQKSGQALRPQAGIRRDDRIPGADTRVSKGIVKTLDILLRPEYPDDYVPYELTHEGRRKRRKQRPSS